MTAKRILTVFLISMLVLTLLPACSNSGEVGGLSAWLDGGKIVWSAYPDAAHYSVTCTMQDGCGYTIRNDDMFYTPPKYDQGDHLYVISAQDAWGNVIARSAQLVYHYGEGSIDDPYEIGSAEELLAMEPCKTVTFGKASVNAPLYYRLTKDIDLTGVDFSPIGNSSKPFHSYFDGNGHKITGLTMTKCNADGCYGLFGATDGATIKNLTLEASMLYDKDSGVSGGALSLGLLVGKATSTTIDNCCITGNVEILTDVVTLADKTLSVGGVAGVVTSGTITCCSYAGRIKAHYGQVNAGGIVGESKSTDPKFAMLNCAANAVVEGNGTAYDVTSSLSKACARVGVIGGAINSPEQVSSLLAVGSATATARDGTSVSDVTSGVFGKTNMSGLTNTVKINHLYYADNIEKVSGTAKSLGTYKNNVHPLSEEALRTKASYLDGEAYGLDFNGFWRMEEGKLPTLSGVGATTAPPSVRLTVVSKADNASYTFDLSETFSPACYALSASGITYQIGYRLGTIVRDDLKLSDPNEYRLEISADGAEPLTLTLKGSNSMPYLIYGAHDDHEAPADFYDGYKVVYIQAATLKTHDFTTAKHITVTILPTETE